MQKRVSVASHFEHRVNRLEQGVATLAADVTNLGKGIEKLHLAVDQLGVQVSSGSKTNWSTLASWAAVILTIVVIASAGFIRDIGRLETSLIEARTQQSAWQYKEGQLDSFITTTKTALQELAEWNRRQNDRIEEHQKLEGHSTALTLTHSLSQKLETLEKEVNRLRKTP